MFNREPLKVEWKKVELLDEGGRVLPAHARAERDIPELPSYQCSRGHTHSAQEKRDLKTGEYLPPEECIHCNPLPTGLDKVAMDVEAHRGDSAERHDVALAAAGERRECSNEEHAKTRAAVDALGKKVDALTAAVEAMTKALAAKGV